MKLQDEESPSSTAAAAVAATSAEAALAKTRCCCSSLSLNVSLSINAAPASSSNQSEPCAHVRQISNKWLQLFHMHCLWIDVLGHSLAQNIKSNKALMHPVSLAHHRLDLQTAKTKTDMSVYAPQSTHLQSMFCEKLCSVCISLGVSGVKDILVPKRPLSLKTHF